MNKNQEKQAIAKLATVLLVAAVVMVWHQIFTGAPNEKTRLSFLNVGQGDAMLLQTASGATVLVDAGPEEEVLEELGQINLRGNYIDMAVITHPQKDHFGGFLDILEQYTVGTLAVNGRIGEGIDPEYQRLLSLAENKSTPIVSMGAGDVISHGNTVVKTLLPNKLFLQSGELNETSLVFYVEAGGLSALLTGDIGRREETYLAERYGDILQADILKVAHHGSRFSSTEAFLAAVRPKVAIVQSGENSYGHPAREALDRLVKSGARVFRNDTHGSVSIFADRSRLRVVGFSEQND